MPVSLAKIELVTHGSGSDGDLAWRGGLPAFEPAPGESTVMFYEIPPGRRLGWHRNSAEEIQFVVSGRGELRVDEEKQPIESGDLFLIPKETGHDICNPGGEDLRVLAFFPATEVEHRWGEEPSLPADARVRRTGGT